jgi:hypothetical protein
VPEEDQVAQCFEFWIIGHASTVADDREESKRLLFVFNSRDRADAPDRVPGNALS